MLNLTKEDLGQRISQDKYSAMQLCSKRNTHKVLPRILTIILIIFIIFLFVPWTQNIRARGEVNTLNPEHRPQMLHSAIPGRVEKWYISEGDFVEKGDTIIRLSEVQTAYFDPQLLERTMKQVNAKESSVKAYKSKVEALNIQAAALGRMLGLKLEQAENKLQQARLKVQSDSMDFKASEINEQIAKQQLDRIETLYEQGLKSKTEFENRKLTFQKSVAEKISAENKLLSSKNDLINAKIELNSIRTDYESTIAKTTADKFTAESGQFDAEATMNKLQNEYSNYSVRQNMYYVTAPQSGYITRAITVGIGEMIKEGDHIVSIMPYNAQLAVEMYVRPIDLPLIEKGQHVRIQFDGWPAIVFSGWPNTSYGTYGGEVYAIDNFANADGLFRVLVKPDEIDHPWPEALRVGGGANSMLLLKDVPIWYELWRRFNGFPPDYYKGDMAAGTEKGSK
ncbi:MAG: HlyD family efflux transporter periplasmic adaptor subunit [Brumimicrobium sp.]|nr:HlyD family efflux transporter periplasmic adaptor subunit [Brumimicrobium sp.]